MEQGGQSPMENGVLPGQGSHHGAAGDPGAAGPLGPGDAEIRRAYEQQQQMLNNGGMPGLPPLPVTTTAAPPAPMSYETESIYMPRILRNQGDSESAGMPSYLQQQQGQPSQQQPQQQSSGMGGYHHQQLNQFAHPSMMSSGGHQGQGGPAGTGNNLMFEATPASEAAMNAQRMQPQQQFQQFNPGYQQQQQQQVTSPGGSPTKGRRPSQPPPAPPPPGQPNPMSPTRSSRDSLPPPPPPPESEQQPLQSRPLNGGMSYSPPKVQGALASQGAAATTQAQGAASQRQALDDSLPPPPPVPGNAGQGGGPMLGAPAVPPEHLPPSPPPPPPVPTCPPPEVDPVPAAPPAPPAPPPPPPPMPVNGHSSSPTAGAKKSSPPAGTSGLAQAILNAPELKKTKPSFVPPQNDMRSDLLKAIRDGIALKKVEQKQEADKAAAAGAGGASGGKGGPGGHGTDVASILARRRAVEMSDSEGGPSDSEYDSDEWGDESTA